MRTRRPMGIGRLPGIARSLSERARAPQPEAATGAAAIDAAEAAVTGLGLGELFSALRGVAAQLGEERGKTFKIGGQDGRVVFGYSVRTGLEGSAEPFGNIAPDGRAPDAAAPRQPIIDVHADGTDIVVIAELPGVDAAEVAVEVQEGALLIAAPGWRKRLDLPGAVLADSLRRTCRNGILEVRLTRRGGGAP